MRMSDGHFIEIQRAVEIETSGSSQASRLVRKIEMIGCPTIEIDYSLDEAKSQAVPHRRPDFAGDRSDRSDVVKSGILPFIKRMTICANSASSFGVRSDDG